MESENKYILPDTLKNCKIKESEGYSVIIFGVGMEGKTCLLRGDFEAKTAKGIILMIQPKSDQDEIIKLLRKQGYTVEVDREIPLRTKLSLPIMSNVDDVYLNNLGKDLKSKYAKGNRKYDKKKFF